MELETTSGGAETNHQHGQDGIDFVTLDDIDFLPPTPPVQDAVGGAGTYSALGARICSPGSQTASVGWVVDMGSDFPTHIRTLIESWETSVVLRSTPERLTTRGYNGYDSSEKRSFRYMTPKKRLTGNDIKGALLWSKSFHFICSPTRCQELVADVLARRKAAASPTRPYSKPLFIWEPVPDLCTPDQLLDCTNTLPCVDICSPNHMELGAFMGDDGVDPETGEVPTSAIERWCEQLLSSMPLQSYTLVIRAGDKGCYLARNGGRKRHGRGSGGSNRSRKREHIRGGLQPDTDMEALFAGIVQAEDGTAADHEIEVDPGLEKWIPAYHQDSHRVVDPTGGGNTFLGGLAVALARGKDIEEAALWGNIAASFAIEQVGVPVLVQDNGNSETWNGVVVEDRLREYQSRLG